MKRMIILGFVLLLAGLAYLFSSRSQGPASPQSMAVAPMAVASAGLPQARRSILPSELNFSHLPAMFAPKTLRQRNRVFLTSREEEEIYRNLSDRHNVDIARAILLGAPDQFDMKNEVVRDRAVNFLSKAIAWKNNPDHAYALSTATEVITSDNFLKPQDIRQKKALAGDKVYLYVAMLKEVPDQAAQLYSQVQGTPTEKVLGYAKALYSRYGVK